MTDNLKWRSPAQLWGRLEHTQQFPRLYLELIKALSASLRYSYFSLRLPSFLVHSAAICFLYRLSGRIFRSDFLPRFLWVMIYVSYSTSIHYFVQLKQYTMEMALALVAMWQLIALLRSEREKPPFVVALLLCAGFMLAPFFSYTYPIVALPVFIIVCLRAFARRRLSALQGLALLAGVAGIILSYLLDTKQVLADPGMQDFWQELIMRSFNLKMLLRNSFLMFRNIGTGDVAEWVFGVLGVIAFVRAGFVYFKSIAGETEEQTALRRYSVLLLCLVIVLFAAGKLPLGTHRLNAFAVPAIGFLIVSLLIGLRSFPKAGSSIVALSSLLYVALVVNLFVTMTEPFSAEGRKKANIFQVTGQAIAAARALHLPIVVTPAIAYPFEDRWTGDWILKTHPAYAINDSIPVYGVPLNTDPVVFASQVLKTPVFVLLDGSTFRIVKNRLVYANAELSDLHRTIFLPPAAHRHEKPIAN